MSSFIHVDSLYRDREAYPNPADFKVSSRQLGGGIREPRQVNPLAHPVGNRPREFAVTLRAHHLILPYNFGGMGGGGEVLNEPYILLDIGSVDKRDHWLISSMGNKNDDAKFVAVFEKIQNDKNGNPTFIHYKVSMEQVTRFTRDYELVVRLFDRKGDSLNIIDTMVPMPADPTRQVTITLEVKPYIIDGNFINNMINPIANIS